MTGHKTIELTLKSRKIEYVKEFLPIKGRKFRADFYLPKFNCIIEYEGIISTKSRHTSIKGYTADCEKYNMIAMKGYLILRFSALNLYRINEYLDKIIMTCKQEDQANIAKN